MKSVVKYMMLLTLLVASSLSNASVSAKPFAQLNPKPFPVYKINFKDDLTSINTDLLKKYNRDSSYFGSYMRFYYPMLTVDCRKLIPINIPFGKKIESSEFKKKKDLTFLLFESTRLLIDYKTPAEFGGESAINAVNDYLQRLIKIQEQSSDTEQSKNISALFTINYEVAVPNGDLKKLIFNIYSSYSRFIKSYYNRVLKDGVVQKDLKKFDYQFNIVRNDWVEYALIDSVEIIKSP